MLAQLSHEVLDAVLHGVDRAVSQAFDVPALEVEADSVGGDQGRLDAVAADVALSPAGLIVVEDESAFVGRRTVPASLWHAMRAAPVVWLEAPLPERVQRVFDGYVRGPTERHGRDAALTRRHAGLHLCWAPT